MPMIDFQWDPKVYTVGQMEKLSRYLEPILRHTIKEVRGEPSKPYNVIVTGKEFPPITFNTPDLEIRIEYHREWRFSREELNAICGIVAHQLPPVFLDLNLPDAKAKLRFYERSGYVGLDI